LELWHESTGKGAPLVFIHAGVCDSRMWEPQWRSFGETHRIVRFDLRGFGRSAIPPARYSDGSDVIDLLGRLNLGRASVIGASLGGRVALEVTLTRPDLVDRLVLVSASLPGHNWSKPVLEYAEDEDEALEAGDLDAAVEANLRMWVDGPHREPDAVEPELRRFVGEMQRRAFELQLPVADIADEDLLVADARDRLGDVEARALVVTGDEDVADVHQMAAELGAGIPGAETASIGSAAHLPSLERPEEFDRIVREFLERQ
jgi:3-oxoadipate enol-lactonase